MPGYLYHHGIAKQDYKRSEYPYNATAEVLSAKSAAMHRDLRVAVLDNKRASLHAWQDRVRDPSLTVLLVLQLFLMFLALPLAASGVPVAEQLVWSLLLVVLTLVVVLSHRGVAIVCAFRPNVITDSGGR